MRKCSTCEGTGLFAKKDWHSDEIPCDDCNGTGEEIMPEQKSIAELEKDIAALTESKHNILTRSLQKAELIAELEEQLAQYKGKLDTIQWEQDDSLKREAGLRAALEFYTDRAHYNHSQIFTGESISPVITAGRAYISKVEFDCGTKARAALEE